MRRATLILLPLALAGCAAKPTNSVPSGQGVAAPSTARTPRRCR